MRSFAALPVIIAIAAAVPHPNPQDIDYAGIAAIPNPTYTIAPDQVSQIISIDTASAISAAIQAISNAPLSEAAGAATPVPSVNSGTKRGIDGQIIPPGKAVAARGDCSALLNVANNIAGDNLTVSEFQADAKIASAATGAETPTGYNLTFSNLKAATAAYGYMGYIAISTYDPSICSAHCNDADGCLGFNIFFERDPLLSPAASCMDPDATATIKCSFWAGPVSQSTATNSGELREEFQVVYAGSNGYLLSEYKAIPGYGVPVYLGNAVINAPRDCNGVNTYMGYKLFTSGIFDSALCTAACDAQNAYNLRHPPSTGAPKLCHFVVSYILYENDVPKGQYCTLYSESWGASYATNTGEHRGSDVYTIEYSFAYSNETDPGNAVCTSAVSTSTTSTSSTDTITSTSHKTSSSSSSVTTSSSLHKTSSSSSHVTIPSSSTHKLTSSSTSHSTGPSSSSHTTSSSSKPKETSSSSSHSKSSVGTSSSTSYHTSTTTLHKTITSSSHSSSSHSSSSLKVSPSTTHSSTSHKTTSHTSAKTSSSTTHKATSFVSLKVSTTTTHKTSSTSHKTTSSSHKASTSTTYKTSSTSHKTSSSLSHKTSSTSQKTSSSTSHKASSTSHKTSSTSHKTSSSTLHKTTSTTKKQTSTKTSSSATAIASTFAICSDVAICDGRKTCTTSGCNGFCQPDASGVGRCRSLDFDPDCTAQALKKCDSNSECAGGFCINDCCGFRSCYYPSEEAYCGNNASPARMFKRSTGRSGLPRV